MFSVLDDAPVLDGQGLKLCLWMRERYFCTVYDAARAMLPAGLWFSIRDSYHIASGVDREASYTAAGRSRRAVQILDLIWACGGSAEVNDKPVSIAIREIAEGKVDLSLPTQPQV